MIVVSNTSPITNLAAIGQLSILRQIYGTLYIPEAVYRELREGEERGDHPHFLEIADWIQVRSVPPEALLSLAPYQLDRGEAEAIVLAQLMEADLLLIGERIGRRYARERNLRVVGVLGTLVAAKQRGIIDAVHPLLEQLRHKAGFYVSDQLLTEVLRRAGE